MRQLKRLFYIILLNVIISAITVGVVLQLWERDHPPMSTEDTPNVIVVTATQPVTSPNTDNSVSGINTPVLDGLPASGTIQATPTFEMLTYRVKEGDTLGALGVQFNLSVEDLMIANNLTDPDSLYVGQIIFIPTAPLPKATSTSIPTIAIASPSPRPSATSTHGSTPTAAPTQIEQEPRVIIDTVIGAGTLENERVVLHRTGDGDVSLLDWRLADGAGNEYVFPMLTLYKGGSINLNTRTGQDSVVDLFWGLTSPVWTPGEIVSLYDAQNILHATYTVP
ncbi:MAG: hypothetical protein A2Y88_06200 [Chloroflexi bacterium RBG_13_48_10]|nr:MAG: hypothetical protein A2Y88_06200 [Chloroflexi bacterium RBG_13_48_10]